MNIVNTLKVDRTAFSIASLSEDTDEKEYWLSKTPYERLEALEWMRQVIYGYSPSTTRLLNILESEAGFICGVARGGLATTLPADDEPDPPANQH